MALNFPSGQQPGYSFTGDNGITYTYDGVKWLANVAGGTGGGGPTDRLTSNGNEIVMQANGALSFPFSNGVITSGEGDMLLQSPGGISLNNYNGDTTSASLSLYSQQVSLSTQYHYWNFNNAGLTFDNGAILGNDPSPETITLSGAQHEASNGTYTRTDYNVYPPTWYKDADPGSNQYIRFQNGGWVAFESEINSDNPIYTNAGTNRAPDDQWDLGYSSAPAPTSTYQHAANKWHFSNTGNLTLPRDSNINFANGVNILSTITGGANLGHLSVDNNNDLYSNDSGNFVNFDVNGDGWMRLGTANSDKLQLITDFFGTHNVWEFGANGSVVFPDNTVQTTAYTGTGGAPVIVGNVAEGTEGSLWYNTDDGRLYANIGTAWVDASPTVAPAPSYYLGNNLEIDSTDESGHRLVILADANSDQPGILDGTQIDYIPTATLEANDWIGAGTNDPATYATVTFANGETRLISGWNTDSYGTSGFLVLDTAITIVGPDAWPITVRSYDYVYPSTVLNFSDNTLTVDHTGNLLVNGNLVTGSSGGTPTDVYDPTGDVTIQTQSATWTFNACSTLSWPSNNLTISTYGANSNFGSSGGTTFTTATGFTFNANTGAAQWQLDVHGNLILPTGGFINYANGVNILSTIEAGSTYSNANVASYLLANPSIGDITFSGSDIVGAGNEVVLTADTTNWTFYANANLVLPANATITYSNGVSILSGVGGTDTGNILFSDTTMYTVANTTIGAHGNVYINTLDGDYTWTFDANGNLHLPTGLGVIGAIETVDSVDLYGDINTQYVQLNYNNQNFVYVDSTGAHMQAGPTAPGEYEIFLSTDGSTTFPDHMPVSITGNLTVGNLTVTGNSTIINTTSYTVSDNIVQFADGNPADTLDLGFIAHRTVGSTLQHTGLVRDASANNWKLFSNVLVQPGDTVDFAGAIYDNLTLGNATATGFYVVDNTASITNAGEFRIWATDTNITVYRNGRDGYSVFENEIKVYANNGHITSVKPTGLEIKQGSLTFADGSTQTSAYGNANVAAYLVANPQGGTYSNTNVAAYLTAGNISVGPAGYTVLPNIVAQFTSNVNSYGQVNLQNINSGSDATTEYVATANNGNDTTFFVDLGIANNSYDVNSPNNSLGNVIYANDSYLYAQGNTSATLGGNLAIGASTAGRVVRIFAGGINNTSTIATFASTGLTVAGNITQQSAYYETFANVTNTGGNLTCNFVNGSVFYATLTANVTLNITNVVATSGTVTGVTLIVDQGVTPYSVANLQINGGGIQTIKWAGGVGSNPGTGSNTDIMSFSLINLNGTAYRVLGQIGNYG